MSDFNSRLAALGPELQALYHTLYHTLPEEERSRSYEQLLTSLRTMAGERPDALQAQDEKREAEPGWYRRRELLGMCLYVGPYAGTLQGVSQRLPYLEECGVNCLHLMPLLDTFDGESDGGYAVADFRKVKPGLGTMDDLEALTSACRERGMLCCMDFVMNHTARAHEWARRAAAGEKEYQDRYFFYDDRTIPDAFEQTVPQVFPTTAPGSFTWCEEAGKYVMTSFYPYQWDLNYGNPEVLRLMAENMLFLANRGVDIIRIDAVPYIWKELGTSCRNLPQVHLIVRMFRLITELVCPGVILLGEVVMAPEKLAPYFGTPEKPECHMLYNATAMCTLWHTAATQDARLLRHQLQTLAALPKEQLFLNYLRCHDDIGWGLDYPFLRRFGMEETPHKAFLNAWFCGELPGSAGRGERYNDDPTLGDARLCGTAASLTGIQAALNSGDSEALETAIRLDLMLHAFVLGQSGLPILYAGDEIAQLNDEAYRCDPLKADDSRYLHRGAFSTEAAERRHDPQSVEGRIFRGLQVLLALRRAHPAFGIEAEITVPDTEDDAILIMERRTPDDAVTLIYNFSRENRSVAFGGKTHELPPCGYVWLT